MSDVTNKSDDGSPDNEFIQQITDEFRHRLQQGDGVSIEEYCRQYPDFADQIREALRTVEFGQQDLSFSLGTEVAEFENEPPSEKIGLYRIVREIGRGGMGVVYRAEHESLGRHVALKVLPARMSSSPKAVARFQREGRSIASLHHTNIVPLYEVGEDQGQFFLAMQLIEGESLDQVIRKLSETEDSERSDATEKLLVQHSVTETFGETDVEIALAPSPKSEVTSTALTEARSNIEKFCRFVADVGAQAAHALDYAHQRGLTHRDVKPSNLILDKRGVVWLTDFGLAKSDEEELTQTGDVLGTVRFMAPERFDGDCDHRSDVYSLGLTLYEFLTLQPAFPSSQRLNLIYRIRTDDPAKIRAIQTDVPLDLETIILKAVEKDPAHRYRSALEFAEDLERFLRDEPIRARRMTWMERIYRWSRRNRSLAATLSALAIVLLLTAFGTSIAARYYQKLATDFSEVSRQNQRLAIRMESERDTAISAEREATQQRQLAQESAAENRRNLYLAEMILAGNSLEKSGGLRRVRQLLQAWVPEMGETDLRGPEWHYLDSLGRADLWTFDGHEGLVIGVEYSPSGEKIATSGVDGTVRILAAKSGEQIQFLRPFHDPGKASRLRHGDVSWSPDDALLATAGENNSVIVWDVGSGQVFTELRGHKSPVRTLAWSPDGRLIASTSNDGIRLWEMPDGEMKQNLLPSTHMTATDNLDHIADVSWRSDSQQIASLSQNATILVWNVETGKIDDDWDWIREALKYWFGNQSINFDSTGDRLLVTGRPSMILEKEATSSSERERINEFQNEGGDAFTSCWSHDDSFFITAGENQEVIVWSANRQRQIAHLRGHTEPIHEVSLSPDGRRIATASADGTVKAWKFPDVVDGDLWCEGAFSFSPNGRFAALTGGSLPQILILDVETQNVVHKISTPETSWLGFVEWSPDSTKIATGFGNPATDAKVLVWDLKSDEAITEPLRTLDTNAPYVQSIAWNPVETNVVAVSQNLEGPIEFWNVETGELIETMDVPQWTWDALEWSPDGQWLAVASWRPLIVDWSQRRTIQSLEGHSRNVRVTRFNQDGSLLATTGQDGTICIFETKNWELIEKLEGHTSTVLNAAWNPRSTRLATTSSDGTLRLWNTTSSRQALSLNLNVSVLRELEWTADGRFIGLSVNKNCRFLRMTARGDE